MRLRQHITEGLEPLPLEIIQEVMKANLRYLKDVKGLLNFRYHYLSRGIHGNQSYIIKQPRQDRMPTDSNMGWHNALNAELFKKFGIEARSKAVFCSKLSSGYGSTNYMLFPIGDFYMIYSSAYPDLFLEQPDRADMLQVKAEKIVMTCTKTSSWDEAWRDLRPINEIMVVCKKYLMVNRKYTMVMDDWIRNEVE